MVIFLTKHSLYMVLFKTQFLVPCFFWFLLIILIKTWSVTFILFVNVTFVLWRIKFQCSYCYLPYVCWVHIHSMIQKSFQNPWAFVTKRMFVTNARSVCSKTYFLLLLWITFTFTSIWIVFHSLYREPLFRHDLSF